MDEPQNFNISGFSNISPEGVRGNISNRSSLRPKRQSVNIDEDRLKIQVYCRIRPNSDQMDSGVNYEILEKDNQLTWPCRSAKQSIEKFIFAHVFNQNSTQDQIYDKTVSP